MSGVAHRQLVEAASMAAGLALLFAGEAVVVEVRVDPPESGVSSSDGVDCEAASTLFCGSFERFASLLRCVPE
jgi:hypothetical protein